MTAIVPHAEGITGRRALRLAMVAAVALNMALIGVAAAGYPVILAGGRLPWVLADVAVLVAYGVVGIVATRKGSKPSGLWRAAGFGVAAGAVQSADLLREFFGLGQGFAGIVAAAVVVSTVVLWCLAGAVGDGVRQGALTGAWSSMVAMLVLWVMAWLLTYAFRGPLERHLASSYQYLHGNTLRDLPAFTVWNTLSFAFSHELLFVAFGIACGAVGAAVVLLVRRWQRPDARPAS
jgi:hypothetical protein